MLQLNPIQDHSATLHKLKRSVVSVLYGELRKESHGRYFKKCLSGELRTELSRTALNPFPQFHASGANHTESMLFYSFFMFFLVFFAMFYHFDHRVMWMSSPISSSSFFSCARGQLSRKTCSQRRSPGYQRHPAVVPALNRLQPLVPDQRGSRVATCIMDCYS